MAKLHFYYAAMNAGKSAVLLQSNYNYKERGMDTILFVPEIDTRFEKGKIHSRIGLWAEAITFGQNFDLYEAVSKILEDKSKNIRCVLIDEAHFITKEQVIQMKKITDLLDLPVLAYGLRSDFTGEPFESSKYLLAWAEELIEIKTICHCGKKATMNMRIDDKGKKIESGEQFFIGGNDSYISTCHKHFKEGNSGIKKKV